MLKLKLGIKRYANNRYGDEINIVFSLYYSNKYYEI